MTRDPFDRALEAVAWTLGICLPLSALAMVVGGLLAGGYEGEQAAIAGVILLGIQGFVAGLFYVVWRLMR